MRIPSRDWITAGLATVATASSFLPWGSSGSSARSSYGILDIADRADILPPGARGWTFVWFLLPAGCGAGWLAVALRRETMLGVLAGTLGFVVAGFAALVAQSPLVTHAGAHFAMAAGLSSMVAGAAMVFVSRRASRGRTEQE